MAINWYSNGYITAFYTAAQKKPSTIKLMMSKATLENESKELSESEKWAVVAYSNFYRNEETLQLDNGGLNCLQKKIQLSKRRIGQICEEYVLQVQDNLYSDLKPKKKGRVGRKLCLIEEIRECLIKINQNTRGQLTNRALLVMVNKELDELLSYATFLSYLVVIGFYNVDSYLKPSL